jgi:hypothetical protein
VAALNERVFGNSRLAIGVFRRRCAVDQTLRNRQAVMGRVPKPGMLGREPRHVPPIDEYGAAPTQSQRFSACLVSPHDPSAGLAFARTGVNTSNFLAVAAQTRTPKTSRPEGSDRSAGTVRRASTTGPPAPAGSCSLPCAQTTGVTASSLKAAGSTYCTGRVQERRR